MSFLNKIFSKQKKHDPNIIRHSETGHEPRIGFSDAPPEWAETREKYYAQYFGAIENISVFHELIPFIPHVDVYVYPPSESINRNYYTLITSGMSDEKMSLQKGIDKSYSRAELIFYIADHDTQTQTPPWYVSYMQYLAHFPFNLNTWLGTGHTIPNGNPPEPFVEGSELTTALLLPAIFEQKNFQNGLCYGNEQVNFLWLTYLTNAETQFKLEHGLDALVDKFTIENFPPVFDPYRKSII